MTPHAAVVENGRDRWKTPDANPRYEPDSDPDPDSGVNAVKCPPKRCGSRTLKSPRQERALCKAEPESEVADARPIETNDHSGEWTLSRNIERE